MHVEAGPNAAGRTAGRAASHSRPSCRCRVGHPGADNDRPPAHMSRERESPPHNRTTGAAESSACPQSTRESVHAPSMTPLSELGERCREGLAAVPRLPRLAEEVGAPAGQRVVCQSSAHEVQTRVDRDDAAQGARSREHAAREVATATDQAVADLPLRVARGPAPAVASSGGAAHELATGHVGRRGDVDVLRREALVRRVEATSPSVSGSQSSSMPSSSQTSMAPAKRFGFESSQSDPPHSRDATPSPSASGTAQPARHSSSSSSQGASPQGRSPAVHRPLSQDSTPLQKTPSSQSAAAVQTPPSAIGAGSSPQAVSRMKQAMRHQRSRIGDSPTNSGDALCDTRKPFD